VQSHLLEQVYKLIVQKIVQDVLFNPILVYCVAVLHSTVVYRSSTDESVWNSRARLNRNSRVGRNRNSWEGRNRNSWEGRNMNRTVGWDYLGQEDVE